MSGQQQDRTEVKQGRVDIGGPRLAAGWGDGEHPGTLQTPQSRPDRAIRQADPERDRHEFQGGPRRSVPDHDILFVGRVVAPAPARGTDREARPRLTSVTAERLQSTTLEESPMRAGSPQRTFALSVILAFLLIWMAYAKNLFAPRPIEVPTTLNGWTRIT